jgi:SAM-dependent methyltransferase
VDQRDLNIAADFCKIVETSDLLEYLGLQPDCTTEVALESLGKKRRYMQSMQNNPKFKSSAKYLIKNMRSLERTLADPQAHVADMATAREDELMPMLHIALDGVLADRVLKAEEESFVRKLAIDIGVSEARYEAALKERATFHNARIEMGGAPSGILHIDAPTLDDHSLDMTTHELTKLRGAAGHAWWDAAFTRLLLETIPGGPGELVDIYCRTALSALTLLPERRQLSYLGVDKSRDRIAQAEAMVARDALDHAADRIALTIGTPDRLPLADASVDYVLAIRALANVEDTRPVFAEALRVLRPGGRIIIAEPDGYAEAFLFESHLVDYNEAFRRLVVQVDRVMTGNGPVLGRPGVAIGPTLTARMRAAGFEPGPVTVHASHNMRRRRFRKFVRQLQRYPQAIASQAGLLDTPAYAEVQRAVNDLISVVPENHVGMSGHVLPLFLAVGIKE